MSRQEECLTPGSSGHGTVCRSTDIDGTDAQSSASFIAPVIEAQLALFELTSQCALAWISAPMMMMATLSGTRDHERHESQVANVHGPRNRVTARLETSGLVPMITGIEDTLHDEFFEPRPSRMTEQEMATLWKRSNEFESRLTRVDPPDNRQVAA